MKKSITTLVILLFCIVHSIGQYKFIEATNQNLYPSMCKVTSDGHMLLTSSRSCYTPNAYTIEGCQDAIIFNKIDFEGNIIWSNNYPSFSMSTQEIIEKDDSSFTLIGRSWAPKACCGGYYGLFGVQQIEILSFDNAANFIKEKIYYDECILSLDDVVILDNGNPLILGDYSGCDEFGNLVEDVRLLQLDKDGGLIAENPVSDWLGRPHFVQAQDKLYIFEQQGLTFYRHELDESNQIINSTIIELDIPDLEALRFESVFKNNDGDLFLDFEYRKLDQEEFTSVFGKLNEDGTALSTLKEINNTLRDSPLITEENVIVVAGVESINGVENCKITYLDQNLNTLDSQVIVHEGDQKPINIILLPNGKIQLFGTHNCCNKEESVGPGKVFYLSEPLEIQLQHPDLPGLKAFYDGLNGSNWINKEGWSDGVNDPNANPCDGWHGISCNSDGRVVELDIRVNNLSGELPQGMTGIEFLEEVFLPNNNITGPIPAFISEFDHLRELTIHTNSLEGPLPPEIGNAESLVKISLSYNDISGSIPPEIGLLPNLEFLRIDGNELSGTIPEEIGNIATLDHLNLAANNFEGDLPSSLTNLTNLGYFSIRDNNFEGSIPEFIGDMTSLLTLSLGDNNFSGELPASMANLTKLQNLTLSENNLSGELFGLLMNMPQLRSLRASRNNFSGTIPKDIFSFTNLNILELSYNNFTGRIPLDAGNQPFFNSLLLNNNDFSECLDSSFLMFCGDDRIDFSNNPKLPWKGDLDAFCQTNGTHAEQVGAPCNILNSVNETIDENCDCVTNCDHPDYNGLMSVYSSTLGYAWHKNQGWNEGAAGSNCEPCTWYGVVCDDNDRVIELNLSQNNLRGSLPMQLGELTELTKFSAANNDIGGQLPESIYSISNLETLQIQSNEFYGELSDLIGNLDKLKFLSLSNCNLSGEIPTTIGNLTELVVFSASLNEISGTIPEAITQLTKLESLSLELNNISGELPLNIGNLSLMRSLRLFGNQLSGSIPASLGDLDSLFILYLQDNNLSGCFDENLLNLCSVGELRMNNNIELPWSGEFDKFCETSGQMEEQDGAYCGLGGSGIIDDCQCIKSNEVCFSEEGILCMDWVIELVQTLDCYDFGFGNRANFNLAVSSYKDDPVLVAFIAGEIASEVYSTQNVYTCDGELLESCSYSLGTNCPDSITIFSQLIPYPTTFYKCMEDQLPDCSEFVQHPDYNALSDLFYATNGLDWINQDGWREGIQNPYSNPCDGWFGVSCDDDNRVSDLFLFNNLLDGNIPSSFGDLSHLKEIDFSNNSISGELPLAFGQLANLEEINMNNNQISGDIFSVLGAINKLRTVSFQNNNLGTTLSPQIGNLQNLAFLNLASAELEGEIPSEIANCSELVGILLSWNNLEGSIPSEIAQMESLETFGLKSNNLSGCLPEELYALCGISIELSGNSLLPWKGNMDEFCATNGTISAQFGAFCDDGDNTNGTNDGIDENCNCMPEIVSVDEYSDLGINVFPNPTTSIIYIEQTITRQLSFSIFDPLGKLLIQNELRSDQIDLSTLESGVYLIELKGPESEITQVIKIVKL